MESLEAEVLEVVKQQPEKNPDGSLWKIRLGNRNWSKQEILDSWKANAQLRKDLVKIILNLKIHKLSRGKPK